MDKKIIKLHKFGLSNRQIAISLNLKHHDLVGRVLKKNGLIPNGSVRKEKLVIKNNKGLCTKCRTWKPLGQFKINRAGKKYQYRLTFCNKCGWERRNQYLNSNLKAYLRSRYNMVKQHAVRRKIKFSIKLEEIEKMYSSQKGRCGYTNKKMSVIIGIGKIDNTLSFDRFDNSKGYVSGNVVLCTKMINVVKSNMGLKLLKKWMPKIYKNGLRALS